MNSPENLAIISVGGISPTGKAASILSEGVDLTGLEKGGNVLVIPTALTSQEKHNASVVRATELFGNRLGLPLKSLHDYEQMPSTDVVEELLEWANLVYISGGDTMKMMNIWKKYGVDTRLKMRAFGGLVLTGISAGAIAPYTWGHSDWQHYHQENWQFERVEGMGLIEAAVTPHNDTAFKETTRENMFKLMLQESSDTKIGFGIDEFAGIKIHSGTLEVKSAENRKGVTIFNTRNEGLMEISRPDQNQPIPLKELGLAD